MGVGKERERATSARVNGTQEINEIWLIIYELKVGSLERRNEEVGKDFVDEGRERERGTEEPLEVWSR